MIETKSVEQSDFEKATTLTESQVIQLRDIPESVREGRDIEDGNNVSVIGETLYFKGELSANKDLVIEGTVEDTTEISMQI